MLRAWLRVRDSMFTSGWARFEMPHFVTPPESLTRMSPPSRRSMTKAQDEPKAALIGSWLPVPPSSGPSRYVAASSHFPFAVNKMDITPP